MTDEELDRAAGALREEASDVVDGDATLARVLVSLAGDAMHADEEGATLPARDPLVLAAHALRRATDGAPHDGTADAVDADGVDADATLARIRATIEGATDVRFDPDARPVVSRRRARAVPWIAIAAAALLAVALGQPTALAWWRGAVAAVRAWASGVDAAPTDVSPPVAPHPPRVLHARTAPVIPGVLREDEVGVSTPAATTNEREADVATAATTSEVGAEPGHVRRRSRDAVVSGRTGALPPSAALGTPVLAVGTTASATPSVAAHDEATASALGVEPSTTEATPTSAAASPMTAASREGSAVVDADRTLAERAERELFERAQQAHLGGAGPVAAVGAWDRYLAAYPDGRYAPEARYNRALALVRAGRLDDARLALQPIAATGGYRAREARELLDAIAVHR